MTRTIYKIATEDEIYKAMEVLDLPDIPGFPTVIAARDGKIIGLLGTHEDAEDAVIAGPMDVKSQFIVPKLVDAYDIVLRKLGITQYLFYTWDDAQEWNKIIQKFPQMFEFLGENDSAFWYKRNLGVLE